MTDDRGMIVSSPMHCKALLRLSIMTDDRGMIVSSPMHCKALLRLSIVTDDRGMSVLMRCKSSKRLN